MKINRNLIFSLLLVSFFSIFTFGQETKTTLFFSVLDENKNFFADVKKDDIQVLQGKQITQNISIRQKTAQSLDVAIMIDTSISQEKVLPYIKLIVSSFIDNVLKKNDRVAIVRFTGETSVEQVLTENFLVAKEKTDRLEIKFPKGYNGGGIIVGQPLPKPDKATTILGATSIWDSIKFTIQTVFDNQNESRKIILLFTDGVDTFSENKLKDVIALVSQTKIPVYAIGIGDDYNFDGVDEKTLKKVSEQTGGEFFAPKNSDRLPKIFNQIVQSSRSFYELDFTPVPTSKKDKLNEIKIEFVNPSLRQRKLRIIQQKGFFLPINK